MVKIRMNPYTTFDMVCDRLDYLEELAHQLRAEINKLKQDMFLRHLHNRALQHSSTRRSLRRRRHPHIIHDDQDQQPPDPDPEQDPKSHLI